MFAKPTGDVIPRTKDDLIMGGQWPGTGGFRVTKNLTYPGLLTRWGEKSGPKLQKVENSLADKGS